MTTDPKESLPTARPNELTIPETVEVLSDDTEERIKQIDLGIANLQVRAVMSAWSQAEITSLKQLHSLVNLTIKTCKHRRAVLEIPYGSKNQISKGNFVFPVD